MKPVSIILLILLFTACSPSVLVSDSWKNEELIKKEGKKYGYIFIAALTQNPEARNTVENDLAKEAINKGYKVAKSSEVFSTELAAGKFPNKETVVEKVKTLGCDAIFTVALARKETESRYVNGTSYSPYASYSYYGTFGTYYGYWYEPFNSPGYYSTGRTYYLESNLYDVSSQGLLWSAQSQIYEPEDLESFSKKFTHAITKRIHKDKVLRK